MGALFLAEASEPQEFAVPSSKQDAACVLLRTASVILYQTDNDMCMSLLKVYDFLNFQVFPTTYAFLFNSSNSLAVWISLVFWLVLYDPVRVGERTWQNHYEHTLNSVVVIVDFFIERRKVFMADCWMVSLKIQQHSLYQTCNIP